jgi:hypothetical protein
MAPPTLSCGKGLMLLGTFPTSLTADELVAAARSLLVHFQSPTPASS